MSALTSMRLDIYLARVARRNSHSMPRLALCAALAGAAACAGDSDGTRDAHVDSEGDASGSVVQGDRDAGFGSDTDSGAGQGAHDAGSGGQGASDAAIQTHLDGGMAIPVDPPKPVLDAAVSGKPLGNTYAETEYTLEQPPALSAAFAGLALANGDTRLFVNQLQQGDAGAEALYGAADLLDGGWTWQKPPAKPGSFEFGPSDQDSKTFVSKPFTYLLGALVTTPVATFRLSLSVEHTVWTATFSEDYENIVTGALYGVVTRAELERHPLDSISCLAFCGLNGLSYCSGSDLHLSTTFDCNDAKLDGDSDGDGMNDGYRLILAFKSSRIEAPKP